MTYPLEAHGIHVVAGGVDVLLGVGVCVSSGQVLGVLGPSGAGKSTLFRVLVGELAPKAGSVLLHGADVTALPLWRRARLGLGYLPQTASVLFNLTVAENIATFERVSGARTLPVGERAASVELEHRLAVRARDLSGGERRRLELLRALVNDPSVLVVDEPFAGGDPSHVRAIAALLRGHADRGRSVVLADHRIRTALDVCDEAILLADARILTRVPAAEFAGHPAVLRRYLEAPNS